MVEYLIQPCAGGKDLVLPQLDVPGFVNSSCEALPSLGSGWGI